MFGIQDWVVIAILIFFLFGSKRLPALISSFGRSKRAFKEGLTGEEAPRPTRHIGELGAVEKPENSKPD